MIKLVKKPRENNEKGSVSLEHMLFVTAVVAVGAGVITFYGNVGSFFSDFDPQTALSAPADPSE